MFLESSAHVVESLPSDHFNAPFGTGRDHPTSYPTNATYLAGPYRPSTHPLSGAPLPASPTTSETHSMRPKRKKADTRQVAILNETYHRTHFPSTEERLHLSTVLGMSPRSVQIWYFDFNSSCVKYLCSKGSKINVSQWATLVNQHHSIARPIRHGPGMEIMPIGRIPTAPYPTLHGHPPVYLVDVSEMLAGPSNVATSRAFVNGDPQELVMYTLFICIF